MRAPGLGRRGEARVGAGGRDGPTRPGCVRGQGWARAPPRRSQARRLALLPVGRRALAPSLSHTAARLARSTASRQGHRGSRRVRSQPAERPRARPAPPSGWPSGLRRCVQVAVSPGGVGSNPTPDKPAFWPARQKHPALWQRFTAFQSVATCSTLAASPSAGPDIHASQTRDLLSHGQGPGTNGPLGTRRRRAFRTNSLPAGSYAPSFLHPHQENLQSFAAHLSSPACGCCCCCCCGWCSSCLSALLPACVPPSHSRCPAPPRPHRRTHNGRVWKALHASPALRLLPGEQRTRSHSLSSTSATSSSPSFQHPVLPVSPNGPPAHSISSTATPRWPATPPCRPLVRALAAFSKALGPWPDHTCLPDRKSVV